MLFFEKPEEYKVQKKLSLLFMNICYIENSSNKPFECFIYERISGTNAYKPTGNQT